MNAQAKQALRMPLNRHTVRVRYARDEFPISGGSHHYQSLHEDYVHYFDDEPVHEMDVALVMKHVDLHRQNHGALIAILDIMSNRGFHHDIRAIEGGSTKPGEVFAIAWDEKMDAPAETHIVTDDGTRILPLPLHDATVNYGMHLFERRRQGEHPRHRGRGGAVSIEAIKAMDAFLLDHGLQPNHSMITKTHCPGCVQRLQLEIERPADVEPDTQDGE